MDKKTNHHVRLMHLFYDVHAALFDWLPSFWEPHPLQKVTLGDRDTRQCVVIATHVGILLPTCLIISNDASLIINQ